MGKFQKWISSKLNKKSKPNNLEISQLDKGKLKKDPNEDPITLFILKAQRNKMI